MKIPEMMKRRIFSYIEAKRGAMLLIAALFNFSHAYLSAQPSSVIDSLEQVLKTVPEDTSKVKLLNNIANELRNEKEYEKSILYGNQALSLAGKLGYKKGSADAYRNIGNVENELNNSQRKILKDA